MIDRTAPVAPTARRIQGFLPWLFLLAGVLYASGGNDYVLSVASLIVVWSLLAYSLNFLIGYAGLVNLGIGAFYAFGAYAAARLSVDGSHVTPILILLGVPLAGFVIGAIIGLPILRTTGLHFATATLAVAMIVTDVTNNWTAATKGPIGVAGVYRPGKLGPLDPTTNQGFFLFAVLVLVLMIIAATLYHRSRVARVLTASRDDAMLTSSLGFELTGYKVTGFATSAAAGALAGVMYAWLIQYVSPAPFAFFAASFPAFVLVAVGGPGSVWGPVIGAVFLQGLPQVLGIQGNSRDIVYGVILLLCIAFLPGGVGPTLGHWTRLALTALLGRRGQAGATPDPTPPAAMAAAASKHADPIETP